MSRRAVVALAALLVFSTVASVAAPAAAAATANISVESVETSVDQPAPGEPFTLSVSLKNLESSSVAVTDIYVRQASSSEEYARVEDVGSVGADDSLTVPLRVTLDEVGEQRLRVHVVVRDADGDYHRVNYPLYVTVEEPDEAVISFANTEAVAGEKSAVDVTVSNGDSAALSNVRLELGGDAQVQNPERVAANIPAGTQTTNTFQVTFPEAGSRTLRATLTYQTSEGVTRTVERNVTAPVEEANLDPQLNARATVANGSSVIRASLSEFGNVELRDVQLRAVVDGDTVARTSVPDVSASGSQAGFIDGSDIPAGEVTIVAAYTATGERRTTETTIDYSPAPTADISLSGVEVSRQDSRLTISGDAVNIGSSDASSVQVSVVPSDGVRPVAPNKEYFVGAVDSSEFSTFELTAEADSSVEQLSIRIDYTVDGERLTRTVPVELADAGTPGEGQTSGSVPGFSLVTVGLALAMLVAAGAVVRFRAR